MQYIHPIYSYEIYPSYRWILLYQTKEKKGWWIEYSVIWEKFWNSQEDKERQHQWRVDLRRGIKPVPGNAASIWGVAMEHGSKEERCWLFVLNGIVASQVACCLHVGLSRGYWLSWARLYRGSICYPSPLEALISFNPCCLSTSMW